MSCPGFLGAKARRSWNERITRNRLPQFFRRSVVTHRIFRQLSCSCLEILPPIQPNNVGQLRWGAGPLRCPVLPFAAYKWHPRQCARAFVSLLFLAAIAGLSPVDCRIQNPPRARAQNVTCHRSASIVRGDYDFNLNGMRQRSRRAGRSGGQGDSGRRGLAGAGSDAATTTGSSKNAKAPKHSQDGTPVEACR
jgi:hypothetical protein